VVLAIHNAATPQFDYWLFIDYFITPHKYLSRKFPKVETLKYYSFAVFDGEGKTIPYEKFESLEKEIIISRTGYTGEDGFEIYAPIEEGRKIFLEYIKEIQPCGLGARDILRIEAGLPLYGNELSEDINPLSANLKKFIHLEKEFFGKEALLKRENNYSLKGLIFESRRIPRSKEKVYDITGKEIGYITSATYSPYFRKTIALAFIEKNRKEGEKVIVGKNKLTAQIGKTKFLKYLSNE